MTNDLDVLVALLDLEQIEVNIFRGTQPDEERQRVFGGQVAAQALMAAGRTVERGTVHSLHSYFLRPGDPAIPILYDVDRIRDGKSFTTRRVVAIQHGRAIFNMQTSFHIEEDGFDHGFAMPAAPSPSRSPRSASSSRAPVRSPSTTRDGTPSTCGYRGAARGAPSASASPSRSCGSVRTASSATTRSSTPASRPTRQT